jgi:hypothetical protein
MDRSGGGGQSLPEHEVTGILMRGTSPWRHGEQGKGTGIPAPVGTRGWRGSDGRVLVKGGGGGARLTRRCTGHGGEGRRRAASAVWRGGGRGAFYSLGEEGRRPGEGGRQSAAIDVSQGFNASAMTHEGVVGEGKRGGGAVLFHWSGGVEAVSGKARGGGGLDATGGGRRPPGWADLGRSWANVERKKISKESWSGPQG